MHPTLGRMRRASPPEDRGIAATIGDMADGLGRLFTESLALARLELAADAKEAALDGALVAGFGVLALIGYVLACVAAAFGLATLIGPALGFLVVGGAHLLAGGVGAAIALLRLGRVKEHALEKTRAEAEETARELRGLASGEVPLPRLAAEAPHHAIGAGAVDDTIRRGL